MPNHGRQASSIGIIGPNDTPSCLQQPDCHARQPETSLQCPPSAANKAKNLRQLKLRHCVMHGSHEAGHVAALLTMWHSRWLAYSTHGTVPFPNLELARRQKCSKADSPSRVTKQPTHAALLRAQRRLFCLLQRVTKEPWCCAGSGARSGHVRWPLAPACYTCCERHSTESTVTSYGRKFSGPVPSSTLVSATVPLGGSAEACAGRHAAGVRLRSAAAGAALALMHSRTFMLHMRAPIWCIPQGKCQEISCVQHVLTCSRCLHAADACMYATCRPYIPVAGMQRRVQPFAPR